MWVLSDSHQKIDLAKLSLFSPVISSTNGSCPIHFHDQIQELTTTTTSTTVPEIEKQKMAIIPIPTDVLEFLVEFANFVSHPDDLKKQELFLQRYLPAKTSTFIENLILASEFFRMYKLKELIAKYIASVINTTVNVADMRTIVDVEN